MLQSIRDKSKGWIAYTIIGFISIPFALWGIESYIGGGNTRIAAIVNGEEIPAAEVQNEILQQKQRMAQMFGGQIPDLGDEMFKQNALSTVIQNALLRQQIREENYRVSNAELIQAIAAIPAFQTDGRFDQEKYERLLQSQRRDLSSFEMEYRQALAFDQYENFAQATDFLPGDQLQKYRQLKNQQRDISYYTVKTAAYRANLEPSEEDIKSYYERNLSAYMTEEKVKLAYLELNEEKIAENIHIDDEILQDFYEKNQDLYVEPEQRQAAHIQIDFDPNGGDTAAKAAEEKAQNIFQQLAAGEKTFAELAKTESSDTLSADKGGDIGFVARGDMEPEFENMLFALDKDGISEPIKLEDRFEIIQLLAVQESKQKSFEEVKADVEKEYRQQEAGNIFLDQSEQLQTLAYENEGSLEPAADATGAKIEYSDWISRNSGETIGEHAAIRTAAFSEDVLKAGRNSEAIELSDTHMIVVRLLEHEKSRQKTLDEVREDVKIAVIEKQIRENAKADGETLLAKLKESNNWDTVKTATPSVSPAATPIIATAPEVTAPVPPAATPAIVATPTPNTTPSDATPTTIAAATTAVNPTPATETVVASTPAVATNTPDIETNSPQQAGFISRTQADIPPTVLEMAFKMTRPAEGQKTWKGFVEASGDYVIISVNAVKDGETTGEDIPMLGGQSRSMILNALRETAEVETFPENL